MEAVWEVWEEWVGEEIATSLRISSEVSREAPAPTCEAWVAGEACSMSTCGGCPSGKLSPSCHEHSCHSCYFRVTEQEIAEWFSSVADPVDVMIHYNNDGR